MAKIEPGIYQHYKTKKFYYILGEGVLDDSITGERVPAVMYRPLYGDRQLTARTLENFMEWIESAEHDWNGPRFVLIKRFPETIVDE